MDTALPLQTALSRIETRITDRPLPQSWSERVQKAWALTEKWYAGHAHWAGMPLRDHVLGVVQTMLPFEPDDDAVIACLLQHVLELHCASLPELEEEFGVSVRSLVSSIHLVSHVSMRSRRRSIEDVRLMLLSVSDDMRVLLTVLCDRTYLLEHAEKLSPPERRRFCRDALALYSPVAARLGIHALKQRIESLAFPHLYPSDAEWITEQIQQLQKRYGNFLDKASQELAAALGERGIKATVTGRQKQPYSIFSKMRTKSYSSVENITDLFALRVIVPTVDDCYRVLGHLHQTGRPIPNRFKDYIAFPKPNGYQSLHTTIAKAPGMPDELSVEVQIRTPSMHREAEYGIAAHWSYKEGGTARRTMQRVQLQQMLTSQHVLEEGRGQVLVDHIYVLTPKGDVIELPEGATPLDFAFQIHSNVGLSFRAARVNGSIVPLDYALENGDVVEVLTHRAPQPSSEWLQLLKMASSRTRLKRYLNIIHRTQYVQSGKEILNEELRKRHLPPLDTDLSLLRFHNGNALNTLQREDLLMKLGQGSERPGSFIRQLDALKDILEPFPAPALKRPRLQRKDAVIQIEGGLTMPVRYAKCCNPAAEERPKIIGIVTRSGDLVVHKVQCKQALRGNPERRVGVKWINGNASY